MDYKVFKKRAFITSVAAGLAYSVIAGKGPFNKMRFKDQHEELAKYVDNNYPNCQYSCIIRHGTGWSSRVLRYGKTISFVYFTKGNDGVYVFTEAKERLK